MRLDTKDFEHHGHRYRLYIAHKELVTEPELFHPLYFLAPGMRFDVMTQNNNASDGAAILYLGTGRKEWMFRRREPGIIRFQRKALNMKVAEGPKRFTIPYLIMALPSGIILPPALRYGGKMVLSFLRDIYILMKILIFVRVLCRQRRYAKY